MSPKYPPLFKRASNPRFPKRRRTFKNGLANSKIKSKQPKITNFITRDHGIGNKLSRLVIDPPYRQETMEIKEVRKKQLTLEQCPKFRIIQKSKPSVESSERLDFSQPHASSDDFFLIKEEKPDVSTPLDTTMDCLDMEFPTHYIELQEDCAPSVDPLQSQIEADFNDFEESVTQPGEPCDGYPLGFEDFDQYFDANEMVEVELTEGTNLECTADDDPMNGFPSQDQIFSQGFYCDPEVN